MRFSALLILATLFFGFGLKADDTGAALRKFTGKHTRLVWIQDAGPTACIYAEKPTMLLMGIDSDDGKGERAIVATPNSFFKPLLTADGQRVVYSDHVAHTVCVVPFAGGEPKVVVHDADFEDVWTDPTTGVEWIYARVGVNPHPGDPVNDDSWGPGPCRRFRMDQPETSELVWDKTQIGHFQVSGDGVAASGAGLNGQGIFQLPNHSFIPGDNGCWPSMAPDDSHRFWVFDGHHAGVHLFTPIKPDETKLDRWDVNFVGAPGSPGNMEALHPRWSNNVRYLVMTGPYARFDWANEAKISNEVAAGVEVYLGRFSEDFHGIEQWIQVSHNKRGDYWPDAWIEPEAAAKVAAKPSSPEAKVPEAVFDDTFQFRFDDVTAPNQTSVDGGKHIRICAMKLTGGTRYGRYGVIEASTGAALANNADQILQACQAADAFSLSCMIIPAAGQINDPATIASFDNGPDPADFALVQAAGHLQVRLLASLTGSGGKTFDLGSIAPVRPLHVTISFGSGKLHCYLDGHSVPVGEDSLGGLKGWTAKAVAFGANSNGEHAWMGSISDIAILSRALDDSEASASANAAVVRSKARAPATRVVVDAVMAGHTQAADPKAIAPYARCLSLSTYDVKNVVEGKLDAKKIAVLQWSVLDSKQVPEYLALKPGDSRRLTLELFSDHPEQDSERQTNEVEGADVLPLYYDVGFAVPTPSAPKAP